MHEKHRHKISVDEFALARGAERPVATKQVTAWGRQLQRILAAKSDGTVLQFQAKQAG